MDTIRTTITLPSDMHEQLRMRALKEKKSLGEIIVEKFKAGKRNLMKKAAGGWKKTSLDNNHLWTEVFKRSSRKNPINL